MTNGYCGQINASLATVVGYILQDSGVAYYVDPSISNVVIRGFLPACTRREALQQAAFAAGAIVNTFGSNVVRLVPLEDTAEPVSVPESNIKSLSVEDLDDVSKVTLTVHNFVQEGDVTELFEGTLTAGTHSVVLDEPGIITSTENVSEVYTANAANMVYATPVNTNQPVVLKGYKVMDNTVEISKLNPQFPEAKQNQNVVSVDNAYFVHAGNADEVLQRVYQYYMKRKRVTAGLVGFDMAPGDRITLPLYDGTTYTGIVEQVTSTYSSRAYRQVVIR